MFWRLLRGLWAGLAQSPPRQGPSCLAHLFPQLTARNRPFCLWPGEKPMAPLGKAIGIGENNY
ncbi:MAG: hypothetical protein EBX47_01840 [Synechococcaceae bacterium WB8_1B_057]|nr:hypothetical protein [Synechococcaceae bacterium WB8_1B_057]